MQFYKGALNMLYSADMYVLRPLCNLHNLYRLFSQIHIILAARLAIWNMWSLTFHKWITMQIATLIVAINSVHKVRLLSEQVWTLYIVLGIYNFRAILNWNSNSLTPLFPCLKRIKYEWCFHFTLRSSTSKCDEHLNTTHKVLRYLWC